MRSYYSTIFFHVVACFQRGQGKACKRRVMSGYSEPSSSASVDGGYSAGPSETTTVHPTQRSQIRVVVRPPYSTTSCAHYEPVSGRLTAIFPHLLDGCCNNYNKQ